MPPPLFAKRVRNLMKRKEGRAQHCAKRATRARKQLKRIELRFVTVRLALAGNKGVRPGEVVDEASDCEFTGHVSWNCRGRTVPK